MKCIVCQTEFEKHVEKQFFCSKKCCDLNYRQTKKGITKVEPHKINCLACNKELFVDTNVRKYCDKKCKNDYKNHLRDTNTMNNRKNKICIICQKAFFPTRTNRSVCSISCKNKLFSIRHPGDKSKRGKEWYTTVGKDWFKDYRKRPYFNEMRRQMFINNPQLKLIKTLRDRAYKAITLQQGMRCAHTTELLGADIKTVREHLERQFKEGMSWDNHGKFGWHIDHIIPCASFDLTDPAQQRKCFHYSNLQPLWWSENLAKNKQIIGDPILVEAF